MSIKLDNKNDIFENELDFPDDINELNNMRDTLYRKMNALTGKISERSENLTELYQGNIKQNRVPYIKQDDEVYEKAKEVDDLVNEFNNTCILIELIEKKIDKQSE